MTEKPQGAIPYAGIPWYSTAFGRDAIITAIEMLWIDPSVAHGRAEFSPRPRPKRLKGRGGRARENRARDALAAKWRARRGAVRLLLRLGRQHAAVRHAGRPLFRAHAAICPVSELWPNIEAALNWIDTMATGTATDSSNIRAAKPGSPIRAGRIPPIRSSMPTAATRWARSRSARCRVMSTPRNAWREDGAATGLAKRAAELDRAAELSGSLRRGVLVRRHRDLCARARWPEAPLQGAVVQCRSAVVHRHRLKGKSSAVAEQLLGPNFFTGWGIRTIASSEARYNPMSYHNGSVWPHDNALIGLASRAMD